MGNLHPFKNTDTIDRLIAQNSLNNLYGDSITIRPYKHYLHENCSSVNYNHIIYGNPSYLLWHEFKWRLNIKAGSWESVSSHCTRGLGSQALMLFCKVKATTHGLGEMYFGLRFLRNLSGSCKGRTEVKIDGIYYKLSKGKEG